MEINPIVKVANDLVDNFKEGLQPTVFVFNEDFFTIQLINTVEIVDLQEKLQEISSIAESIFIVYFEENLFYLLGFRPEGTAVFCRELKEDWQRTHPCLTPLVNPYYPPKYWVYN